jgi:hypothetical protein
MRRLLAVAALCALAGCSRPAPPTVAGPPTPTPAATSATTPSGDPYAANTQAVCTSINGVVKEGTARFATDLGAMVGHLAGGNQPEADKSRRSAQARLTELAGKVRSAGTTAANPVLVSAVGAVASRYDALAADPAFLAGVKTASDLPAANQRVAAATDPLGGVCV